VCSFVCTTPCWRGAVTASLPPSYLSLREEDPPLSALRQRELHRLRVARHAARGQAGHVAHVHVHAGRGRRAHEAGNCEQENQRQDLRFSRRWLWRMASSGMLRRVALVRTDVLEEPSASFIRVTRIGELGRAVAVTSNRRTLRRNTWYQRINVCKI
jgi:hypothetical protein